MVNNVADYPAIPGLWVAALDISFPGSLPDSVPFGAILAAVLNDGIDGPFDCPDVCWNCHENRSFI